jgi:hypothetical protein
MTDVATKTVDQQLVKKTHPIRGILWGLMMGLGLSIVLVLTKVIPLDLVPMLLVLLVGTVAGTLWSIFGPAKHPKDVPEAATESTDTEVQPVDTADQAAPEQPAADPN